MTTSDLNCFKNTNHGQFSAYNFNRMESIKGDHTNYTGIFIDKKTPCNKHPVHKKWRKDYSPKLFFEKPNLT